MANRLPLLLTTLMALSAACGPSQAAKPSPAITASPTASTTPSLAPCAEQMFATMTEAQRVGQLFLLGLTNDQLGPAERQAIQADHIGSVWFVDRTQAGVAGIRTVSDAVQQQAGPATAGVRFFVAANQEGGITQALHGSGFSEMPSALTQGSLDPATLQARALSWGQQLQAAGVNLNFAPVLDVVPPGTDAQNQPIGALQREYGHDPATVGAHGVAVLLSLRQAGVATTLKHFPGLGRVAGNTDYTTATDTVTTSTDPFLQSFVQGIAANADFVMVALATYTRIDAGRLAVFSPIVMRDLLRGTLGYQGVIVSDDLGATAAVAGIPPGTRAIDFLNAGGDMIISKTAAATLSMVQAIRAREATDPGFTTRVDDAALRILRVKQVHGLLPC